MPLPRTHLADGSVEGGHTGEDLPFEVHELAARREEPEPCARSDSQTDCLLLVLDKRCLHLDYLAKWAGLLPTTSRSRALPCGLGLTATKTFMRVNPYAFRSYDDR